MYFTFPSLDLSSIGNIVLICKLRRAFNWVIIHFFITCWPVYRSFNSNTKILNLCSVHNYIHIIIKITKVRKV